MSAADNNYIVTGPCYYIIGKVEMETYGNWVTSMRRKFFLYCMEIYTNGK